MKKTMMSCGKSYALKNSGFSLLSGFINGCGIHGVNVVKGVYRTMFIDNATFQQVIRISGFVSADFGYEGAIEFRFESRTVVIPKSHIDMDRFIVDNDYSDGVIGIFARLVAR